MCMTALYYRPKTGFLGEWHKNCFQPIIEHGHHPICWPIRIKIGRDLLLHRVHLWVQFDPDQCMGNTRPNDKDLFVVVDVAERNTWAYIGHMLLQWHIWGKNHTKCANGVHKVTDVMSVSNVIGLMHSVIPATFWSSDGGEDVIDMENHTFWGLVLRRHGAQWSAVSVCILL